MLRNDRRSGTLVGIAFDDMFRAQEFLIAVNRLAAEEKLTLNDAVILNRDANGRAHVHETIDPTPARSALGGAAWAGLFGLLLGGPVGWVAGTALGAGAGAASAKLVDIGISDEWVAWFREVVQPESTIVALLVEDIDRDALVAEAGRFSGAQIVYSNLDHDTLERVRPSAGRHPHRRHPPHRTGAAGR